MSDNDKKYWRSLGELNKSKDYLRQLRDEHKTEHSHDPNQFSRRNFLTIMGASMALAGLAGCRRPIEKIVPFVKQSEEVIPGVPEFFATTMPLGTASYGVLVESHEGRPTKIEGNTDHPATKGTSNLFMQASILNLYDPDRSKTAKDRGNDKSIDDFVTYWTTLYPELKGNKGEKLAVLSESFSSPTLNRLKKEFEKVFPKSSWAVYEPLADENRLKAISNLTGKKVQPLYNLNKAEIIVSFDDDFLNVGDQTLTSARAFGKKRQVGSPDDKLNRLYVIESGYSITGASADHRLKMRSGDIGQFILALAKELSTRGLDLGPLGNQAIAQFDIKWISAIADDLIENKGKSLLLAGQSQPEEIHEAILLINSALDNFGETIEFVENDQAVYSDLNLLKQLTDDINLGKIDTLIIIGGNPVYNAPADFDFANILKKVKNKIHFGEFYDETAKHCAWHIPRSHFLESWGDTSSIDGTLSVIQPLIAPLFKTINDVELYSLLASGQLGNGYEVVRDTWQKLIKRDFEKGWRLVLHDGLLKDSTASRIKPKINKSRLNLPRAITATQVMAETPELVFNQSVLFDGRYANNGWLQELPNPVTKLVWDNAAVMSVKTAKKYSLENGDMIKITVDNTEIKTPIWIIPGFADFSIGLSLGYGRQNVGRVADNVGVDLYKIRKSSDLYIVSNPKISKTGEKYKMSNTQDHDRMEGRAIYREASVDEYRENPKFAEEMVEHPPLKSIYPDYDYSQGYQWGMTIDLNACIGCGVCTVACQSENNIPIIGKEQVGNGREMHWMRNDRYFTGHNDNPDMVIMPVTCQHCVNAPCEQVCPVAATSHDSEGLNVMTYNRCIGTRYCSNNCPYKVRKFNFFNYTKDLPELTKMAQNPDVTVRSRGVMEKCTFCIQRITRAKKSAKLENRTVADNEFMTACQQACPTGAIKFGNINDKDSIVSTAKRIDRNYALLAEFNVQPRNTYLARIRNYNEKLKPNKKSEKH